jgi:hypothetical protein
MYAAQIYYYDMNHRDYAHLGKSTEFGRQQVSDMPGGRNVCVRLAQSVHLIIMQGYQRIERKGET